MHACMYVRTYVGMYVCMCIYIYMYMYMYMYAYTHAYLVRTWALGNPGEIVARSSRYRAVQTRALRFFLLGPGAGLSLLGVYTVYRVREFRFWGLTRFELEGFGCNVEDVG